MHTIRPFDSTPEEYAALAALQQAVAPNRRAESPEEMQQDDADWPRERLNQRFVGLDAHGRMIAAAACYEPYWQHQPGTVHLRFDIHPDQPVEQILPRLYDTLLAFLAQRQEPVRALLTRAREDDSRRVPFLQKRDFQPVMRSPTSALAVADFDPTPFQPVVARVAAAGVGITTLAQLRQDDPHWQQKLRDLRWALIQDVPAEQPPTEPSLEDFQRMVLDDPALAPDAYFLAVDPQAEAGAGALVGMSNLWRNDPTGKRLDTGLTGTVRGYRRRGIATVLKLCTIEYAQAVGAQKIATSNEENNPMYELNRRLGFVPQPAWISYRKTLPTQGTLQNE